jgi:hypothetical protein
LCGVKFHHSISRSDIITNDSIISFFPRFPTEHSLCHFHIAVLLVWSSSHETSSVVWIRGEIPPWTQKLREKMTSSSRQSKEEMMAESTHTETRQQHSVEWSLLKNASRDQHNHAGKPRNDRVDTCKLFPGCFLPREKEQRVVSQEGIKQIRQSSALTKQWRELSHYLKLVILYQWRKP